MTIRRWEPFNELRRMEEALDRVWGGVLRPSMYSRFWEGERLLPLDVYQTADAIIVKTSVPGVRPEDIDVTIEGNTLTLRGESRSEEEVRDEDYLLQERRFGGFCRSITLPVGVNADATDASYRDGVLTLTIPKREEAKPKTIQVKVSDQPEDQA